MAEAQENPAEWAAALEQEVTNAAINPADELGEESTRVLNQNEIDLLLGFDNTDEANTATGVHAILDKALMAYEKLPMLEVVFDRLVRNLSSSLRNFTSDNVDVAIDSMTSVRFDEYLNSIPLPAMLVVFRAVEWENFGIVTVDSAQIYSTVDVLFGGRRSNRPMRVEGRPYTTIEQDIIKQMVDILLNDMSTAFDPLSPVSFQHERMESNPRFATIARPNTPALLVRFRVDMESRGGFVEICIPHSTLEPIRDLLLQMFMGEKFGHDTQWEKHFGMEVRNTEVEVEVVLEQRRITLGDVMHFHVGKTFLLDIAADDDMQLRCGNVKLTDCKMGRVGDNIAVALNDAIQRASVRS